MAQSSSNFKPDDNLLRQWFAEMQEFKKSGAFCDITLKTKNQEVRAHRVVLAASIPFFSRMLQSDFREMSNEKVEIKEIVDPDILESLINVSYGIDLEISQHNAEKLLVGSDYLQLNHVKKACEDFYKHQLSPENVLETKKIAEKFNCPKLLSAAEEFIDNNFPDFAKTNEFMELEKHELVEIIKRDELRVREEEVYEAVMKWIKYQGPDRIPLLPEVLSNVRLCLLSPVFLYDKVYNESLMKASSEFRILLDEAMAYHMVKGIRDVPENSRNRPRNTGLIYIFGGENSRDGLLSMLQIYNPHKDQWTSINMETENEHSRSCFSASVVFKGKMFTFGGVDENIDEIKNSKVLDLKTKTLVEAKSMNLKISGASAAVLGEIIYVCGGFNGEDRLNLALRYSPKFNTWTNIAPLIQERSGAVAVSLNGYLFVIGGKADGGVHLNNCEKYDPQTNTWSFIKPMETPRHFPGAAVLNGKIYVCGGEIDTGENTASSIEIYDPVTDEWSGAAASMNVGRFSFALVSLNGKLFAIGGENKDDFFSSVEAYDIERNRWDLLSPLPSACSRMNYGIGPQ